MTIDKIKLTVPYNWQVDNFGFEKLKSTAQCGYTSACIVLSAYITDAANDWFVKEFIMEMDKDFLTGKSSVRKGSSQNNYKQIMDKFLQKYVIPHETKVIQQKATVDNIITILKSGSPIMASTMLTSSGHYITIVGIDIERGVFICHDPYGKFDFVKNAYTVVKNKAGEYIEYPIALLSPYLIKSSKAVFGQNGDGYRIIWVG